MAARQAAKPTTIGSFGWIANERATVQQLGEQDIEDFAFSTRNDLEWLNEHMVDIFERNHVDMAELLKTPGRLRGKTPGTGRKQVRPGQGREPLANITDINQPATSGGSCENPFYNPIAQLPSNKEMSPTRGLSKSPARSLRVLQDAQAKKPADPMKDSAISLNQAEASQISIADSGIWSTSSDPQSQQAQQSERVSLSSETFKATKGGDRDSTYRTAPEDSSDPPQQQSPGGTKDIVPSSPPPPPPPPPPQLLQQQPKPKPRTFKLPSDVPKTVPAHQPPTYSEPAPKYAAKKLAPEPRRSGRLVERSSSPLTNTQVLSDGLNEIVPPSSPPNLSHQELSAAKEEEDASTLPTAKPLTPPPAPARSTRPQTPTLSHIEVVESLQNAPAAQTPDADRSSPSRSSSESPAPEIPIVRKSILNFASLPAREPLTNKKKSLGVKTTRESHVEQVRLNGAGRASWMNRKGNGKSLGASSKQIELIGNDADGEEEKTERSDPPRNLKRKSEDVRGDSRKKSKGNIEYMEEEEESSGETAKAMALHNKTSTQRLHDKIQQLGKLNASRGGRSFPSSVSQTANLAYPDLPQVEQDPVQEVSISKGTKSGPQEQLLHNATVGRWTNQADGEEDWIPMKVEPNRQLTRSNTGGMIESKQKEVELERPQSANRWNNSPKSFQAQSIPVRTMTTSESAPNLRSPKTIRHVPTSPLKSSFSEDWIKAPASPSRPPGEGAILAVKAHTSSVIKKAKEMLLKSSVASASAKVETMGSALRSWPGGHNLREQSKNGISPSRLQEPSKQPEQQLYPDLGTGMAAEVEKPSSAKNPAVEQLKETRQTRSQSKEPDSPIAETVVEPARNARQTRSSRSRDTRDGSPEIQKKSKASERAEREEKLREREEKLRLAEEELRLAKEEQRKEEQRKQREEQWRQQEEQLRQAQEELRQAQELQRKHKEEQMQKEKEESKRRQEEKLRQEKEELKRRQQEGLKRQQEESRRAKEIPSSFQDDEDCTDKEEDSTEEINRTRVTSSAEPDRPPSRLQKAGSRFQKTGDNKRPLRPTTGSGEQLKIKAAPVSISVGTASQREMQSQRSKPNMAPSATSSVATLKQSFENPLQTGNLGQINPNTSTSANNPRCSNPGGPAKQLKSLREAANQLKKEQEEKERRLAQKRDLERRRLENQRKLEEEVRKARPKQVPLSTQKTLSRTHTVANLRQTSEEPGGKLDLKSSLNSKLVPVKTVAKRVFQPEATEVYQQEGAKKRKTGEIDERPYEMAPPIRQPITKKGIMSKGGMPHGYAQAPTQAPSSSVPSMLRQPTKLGLPQVEAVKISNSEIIFANNAPPGPSAGPPSAFKTPGAKSASKVHTFKTPAGIKDSPSYQNGESIELPEIPSDSEDEDEDYHAPKDNFHVPQWAESPELRQLLRQQQTVNPEEIFGPMARLDMEAIFQGRTDRQGVRFRARTSSANWSGADRLTPAEIEADQEARRKMIEQGGWKYQPPS